MTDSILDVKDLTVAYRRPGRAESLALWKAGLTLRKGSIFGLAGESGCGKSTFCLAAIGYRPAGLHIAEGTSRLGELDLLRLGPDALRSVWGLRIGYVAQSAPMALNPSLPVGRQLRQVLAAHQKLRGNAGTDRCVELFDAVRLPDPERAVRRYPHQFSGGQQQRIALAMALACEPDVLILDEPTTGLDVTAQARISALIRDLIARTGTAALWVSHDLGLLGTVADDLGIMYAGEVMEQGPASTLLEGPQHPYTRALLDAVPSTRELRGVSGIPGRPPGGPVLESCAYAPRCPHVRATCRSAHVEVRATGPAHTVRCVLAKSGSALPQRATPLPTRVVATNAHAQVEPLLEIDDLWCDYARAASPAVAGVSLSLAPGVTLGIVGESGSGKSTLLRAIAGLHPPSAGTIRLSGSELARRVTKRPRVVRQSIQIIFQNPDSSLNPRHLIREILRRPVRLFGDEVARANEEETLINLLDAVQLPKTILRRYPSELSGGQKQRVAISRALAAKPSILLCDEVTSALDVSVQATIIELLADLTADLGVSVVFVSHDLAVVRTIAGRAMVMKDGAICETADTGRLFAAPQHAHTKELLNAAVGIQHNTEAGAETLSSSRP